jgi:hypothetical protein
MRTMHSTIVIPTGAPASSAGTERRDRGTAQPFNAGPVAQRFLAVLLGFSSLRPAFTPTRLGRLSASGVYPDPVEELILSSSRPTNSTRPVILSPRLLRAKDLSLSANHNLSAASQPPPDIWSLISDIRVLGHNP